MERFRNNLKVFNFAEFPKPNPKVIAALDEVLSEDLPKVLMDARQLDIRDHIILSHYDIPC